MKYTDPLKIILRVRAVGRVTEVSQCPKDIRDKLTQPASLLAWCNLKAVYACCHLFRSCGMHSGQVGQVGSSHGHMAKE